MRRPTILVTLDQGETERRGVPFPIVHTKLAYVRAVEAAGGAPILIAPTADTRTREALLDLADGLVITGGDFDIDPALYGEAASGPRMDRPKPLRTELEWWLTERALERDLPILGICGGMQLLNVVRGGTLFLDIGAQIEGALQHEQPTSPATPDHEVHLAPPLAKRFGSDRIQVNTTHHQAVRTLGRDVEVLGRAPDGVIEAIGLVSRPDVVGVQWHPELLDDAASRALYSGLVKSATRAASHRVVLYP